MLLGHQHVSDTLFVATNGEFVVIILVLFIRRLNISSPELHLSDVKIIALTKGQEQKKTLKFGLQMYNNVALQLQNKETWEIMNGKCFKLHVLKY